MTATKNIQLPQSLINRIQQNPQEDLIALCVQDIIAAQLSQTGVTEDTKKKLKSANFQAKLSSQIFAKSLEKTFLEHPEFTPKNWLKNNKIQQAKLEKQTNQQKAATAEEMVAQIATLKQENTNFAQQFTLNIFDSYGLVCAAITA